MSGGRDLATRGEVDDGIDDAFAVRQGAGHKRVPNRVEAEREVSGDSEDVHQPRGQRDCGNDAQPDGKRPPRHYGEGSPFGRGDGFLRFLVFVA